MRMRISLLLTSLMAVALAGCADTTPEETTDEPAFDDFELDADEDTGIIRGVVVDETITPIVGATVTLEGTEQVVTSTEDGAFGFGDLEPGFYNLIVDAAGYVEQRTQTNVVAGDDEPAVLRVLLEAAPNELPRVTPLTFSGHLGCSMSSPLYRIAVCNIPNTYLQALGQEPVTDDNFMITYDAFNKGVDFVQSEMVWKSTSYAGDEMMMTIETEVNEDGKELIRAWGKSPVVGKADRDILDNTSFVDVFHIRVFNQALEETRPPDHPCVIPDLVLGGDDMCLGGVGLTLQQDFEIFTHLFYNWEPEESYQFSVDGEPVPPS